jgi:hypothetical protein
MSVKRRVRGHALSAERGAVLSLEPGALRAGGRALRARRLVSVAFDLLASISRVWVQSRWGAWPDPGSARACRTRTRAKRVGAGAAHASGCSPAPAEVAGRRVSWPWAGCSSYGEGYSEHTSGLVGGQGQGRPRCPHLAGPTITSVSPGKSRHRIGAPSNHRLQYYRDLHLITSRRRRVEDPSN